MRRKTALPLHPSRQQQLVRLASRMAVLGGSLALLGALALVLGEQGQDEWHRFLSGMGTGILATLPFFFAVMALLMFRQMDEYARQQLLHATGLAFMLTMIVSGALIALQAVLEFSTPAWVFYGVGMLAWAVAAAVLSARDRAET